MENFRNQTRKIISFFLLMVFSPYLHSEFFDPSTEALENRLTPIGKIHVSSIAASQPPLFYKKQGHLGQAIFESHCVLCHGSGIAGAPRFRNRTDWGPRIKKKLPLLLEHVKNGYRAMPPKGACLECSSTDLEAATRYIIK